MTKVSYETGDSETESAGAVVDSAGTETGEVSIEPDNGGKGVLTVLGTMATGTLVASTRTGD